MVKRLLVRHCCCCCWCYRCLYSFLLVQYTACRVLLERTLSNACVSTAEAMATAGEADILGEDSLGRISHTDRFISACCLLHSIHNKCWALPLV